MNYYGAIRPGNAPAKRQCAPGSKLQAVPFFSGLVPDFAGISPGLLCVCCGLYINQVSQTWWRMNSVLAHPALRCAAMRCGMR